MAMNMFMKTRSTMMLADQKNSGASCGLAADSSLYWKSPAAHDGDGGVGTTDARRCESSEGDDTMPSEGTVDALRSVQRRKRTEQRDTSHLDTAEREGHITSRLPTSQTP
jgi:hypothetical protein